MISAGDPTVKKVVKVIDYDSNGKINEDEIGQLVNSNGISDGDAVVLVNKNGDTLYDGLKSDIKIKISNIIAAANNSDPTEASKAKIEEALAKYKEAEDAVKNKTGDTQEAKKAKEELQRARKALQEAIIKYTEAAGDKASISQAALKAAGMSEEGEGGGTKATFAMTNSSSMDTSTGAGTGAKATGTGTSGSFPATGGSNPLGDMKAFTTDAYQQSVMMEDNILSSFDQVLENQNKGKKLMQLFYYFARMAESGDMGAMYQFMKFLTYIISKDKSKQQTEMGNKLLELQNASRKWTDMLLNKSTDSTDPNSGTEFTKTMTQVKSETDAIATSQKLIAQMMEEFGQIVESLTASMKSALDSQGKILSMISRPG